MGVVDEFAGLAGAGDLLELDVGVEQQQPEQLAPNIATPPNNTDL
jgi:hypothetical protein